MGFAFDSKQPNPNDMAGRPSQMDAWADGSSPEPPSLSESLLAFFTGVETSEGRQVTADQVHDAVDALDTGILGDVIEGDALTLFPRGVETISTSDGVRDGLTALKPPLRLARSTVVRGGEVCDVTLAVNDRGEASVHRHCHPDSDAHQVDGSTFTLLTGPEVTYYSSDTSETVAAGGSSVALAWLFGGTEAA